MSLTQIKHNNEGSTIGNKKRVPSLITKVVLSGKKAIVKPNNDIVIKYEKKKRTDFRLIPTIIAGIIGTAVNITL